LALERPGPGGVAVAPVELDRLELVDAADADGADVDDLDLGVETMPVLGLVGRMKGLPELIDPGVVDLARWHVEPHLVALARVAAVGETPYEPPGLGHAVHVELSDGLADELVVP